MNCKNFEISISAYIDDELSDREKRKLLKHIDECSTCRKKLESMKVLSDRMRQLTRIEGDLRERNRILAALQEKISIEDKPKPAVSIFTTERLAWAGVVAALVVVLLITLTRIHSPDTQTLPIPDQEPFVADVFIDGMVEYLENERVHAGSFEVFAEPVLGVFVSEPLPVEEGYIDNIVVDMPQHTQG